MAVLPDGRVASGDSDGRMLMWDPARPGAGPVELGRHDGEVAAAAALPDGRVVSGSGGRGGVLSRDDGRVLMWDPARPGAGPVELGRHPRNPVDAVAVLLDGRVVSRAGGWMWVWDPGAIQGAPAELGLAGDIVTTAVGVLPDGRVVSGGDRGWVQVWDPARPGAGPVELGRHDGEVAAVAVLPDGRVVSGGGDGRVLMWDPARPGAGPVELGRHEDVNTVAVLPGARSRWRSRRRSRKDELGRVVSGGGDGRVLVWDPARPGAGPVELGRHPGNYVVAVAVLPDGRVVSAGNGSMWVWDPARPGADPVELALTDDIGVTAVAVLPDGRVVSGGGRGRMLVWDPDEPRTGPVELGRHDAIYVVAIAVLPDGRIVSSGTDDQRVRLWDVESGSTSSLLACSAAALATSLSPAGTYLFIGHGGGGISRGEVRSAIQNIH